MKRLAIVAIAGLLLCCLTEAAQAHGRGHGHGGWGFSINVAPPPPPCYYYPPPPPPCYGPYGCAYSQPRVLYPWYGPPRTSLWFGF